MFVSSPSAPFVTNTKICLECVELLDDNMVKAVNESGGLSEKLPISDTLFFKIQGTPESMQATGKIVQTIAKKHGSTQFVYAKNQKHADDLWNNRKVALYSAQAWIPGSRVWTTDVWYVLSSLLTTGCVQQLIMY